MHHNMITESVSAELAYRRERIGRSFAGQRRHLRGGRRRWRSEHLDVVPPYGDARA